MRSRTRLLVIAALALQGCATAAEKAKCRPVTSLAQPAFQCDAPPPPPPPPPDEGDAPDDTLPEAGDEPG
jgi:hypothetical protein